ncbi:hypothetical protein [Pseudomonas sp. GL-RE-19]|uniref:hypothetical protein n=1 Tax=Pseudomonas sp. GL-RE-19 TaxID=2832389 RepID=UPI001CC14A1F|nr:hypothetical protein [Pseudomonas sp. GL-RE-19]
MAVDPSIEALPTYARVLSEAAQRSDAASELQHKFVHGDANTVISTESGPLPTLAKWKADTDKIFADIKVVVDSNFRREPIDPNVRSDGSQLEAGDEYFNTSSRVKRVWNGSFWFTPNADGQHIQAYLAEPDGGTKLGFGVVDGVPRTIYLKVAEIRTDTNYGCSNDGVARTLIDDGFKSLVDARKFWPLARSLSDSLDLLAAEQSLKKLREDYSGRPKYLELPPGKGRFFNRSLIGNPTLDCNTPVENITIKGFGGHRGYDTGNDIPSSVSGYGTFDTLFDFRAMRKCKIEGLGIYGPPTINRLLHLGARDCFNSKQMSRVFTLSNINLYGGQVGIDTYLTSGLFLSGIAQSRALRRGLVLDAGGDSEIVECLFNNNGVMVSGRGGGAENEFDGACILLVGGGGHVRIAGGKWEASNKGLIAHNVHSILVDGTTLDKLGEYCIRVSADADTLGKKINMGYQPRGIRFANLKMVSAGWIGNIYNCFVYLYNGGHDNEMVVSFTNCVAAWAGENAIDLDSFAAKPWGVGPTRAAIRAVNTGTGSTIHVQRNGGDWQNSVYPGGPGGHYSFESYQSGITFENIGQDRIGLPAITQNGRQIGMLEEVSATFNWAPGLIPAGATITSAAVNLDGVAVNQGLSLDPPGSLGMLFVQPSMSSNGVAVIHLYNPTSSSIAAPSGDWIIRRLAR